MEMNETQFIISKCVEESLNDSQPHETVTSRRKGVEGTYIFSSGFGQIQFLYHAVVQWAEVKTKDQHSSLDFNIISLASISPTLDADTSVPLSPYDQGTLIASAD